MFLSEIPTPLKAFLNATERGDTDALFATLADDAVLTDMGRDHSGEELRKWNDDLYIGSNVVVHPIHVEERDGETVLAVAVDGDYAAYGVTEPLQLDWFVRTEGDLIKTIRMVEVKLDLPAPIGSFVKAMNSPEVSHWIRTAPGAEPSPSTPAEMRAYMAQELKAAGDLVKAIHLKLD